MRLHHCFSRFRRDFFRSTPQRYPEILPSLVITRWQGTATASLFAAHACAKHSSRVGRSASAQRPDVEAVTLAARAHVRHAHTDYDLLLAEGRERLEARDAVAEKVDEILDRWQYGDDSAGTDG